MDCLDDPNVALSCLGPHETQVKVLATDGTAAECPVRHQYQAQCWALVLGPTCVQA